MKISRLDIEGFRSFRKATWTPGSLNILIGPNGAGKSNLLQVLDMISAAARGQISKAVQSSGGMGSLVWDGQADQIAFNLFTTNSTADMSYRFSLARLGLSSSFKIPFEYLENTSKQMKLLERHSSQGIIFDDNNSMVTVSGNDLHEEETFLSAVRSPFIKAALVDGFQHRLASWTIYHDIETHKGSILRQSTVAKAEKRVHPNGQNLIPVLHTLYTGNRNFKRDIDSAMRAAFGDDFEELVFPPATDQRIQLKIRWKNLTLEQSATDLSDGILRYLFLLTVLSNPSPGNLIAIDNPETGLHPSMLPIIAEYAVDASSRTQLVLSTHSPQFLNALKDTIPTITIVRWSEGQTHMTTWSKEELEYWLQQYSLGNLFQSGELEDRA